LEGRESLPETPEDHGRSHVSPPRRPGSPSASAQLSRWLATLAFLAVTVPALAVSDSRQLVLDHRRLCNGVAIARTALARQHRPGRACDAARIAPCAAGLSNAVGVGLCQNPRSK